MAKSFRNRLLLLGAESTYGTAATMTGSNALIISNLDITPLEVSLIDRELIRPYFGNTQKVVGQRMASVKFDCEMAASGVAGTAPRWGAALKACGFAETIVASTSVSYSPVSTGITSVSFDVNYDGTRHLLTGCRGTVSVSVKVGEIPKLSFDMMAIYNAVTSAAAVTPTFGNQADPVVVNSTNTTSCSIQGYSACLEDFSLDLGNDTVFRQLAGCSQEVLVTDRKPSGELTIEAPVVGSGGGQKDFFAAISAQTIASIGFQHGQTAGNILTFAAPYSNLDSPSYADSDGVQMLKFGFMPNPSSAGNNELTFALT